ncbi:M20 family metallo-hydrolase [bacterium]|nr:M20 family metallo-hydrolase [bacterium]
MNDTKRTALAWIEQQTQDMIELQAILTSKQALSPDCGGTGEWQKGEALTAWLKANGFPEIESYHAPDPRADHGLRPNICVRYPGRNRSRTLWIIAHLDVVPAGDVSLWQSDPWQIRVEHGRVYGRGTEDNQQAMVASAFALKSLIVHGFEPATDVALLFVADEETGSQYGLDYLVKNFDLFQPTDLVLIPDAGNETGTMIQVAEKSILWLRFTTLGKQTHASRPSGGINAMRAAAYLVVELDTVFKGFDRQNELFDPPVSTFEPTLHEENVSNINTIPGRDVFCFDCRILPEVNIEQIMNQINTVCRKIEHDYGVTVTVEIAQKTQSAPATSPQADIVKHLSQAIRSIYQVEPYPLGVGGGTVANFLRLQGIPAAVWSRHDKMAHQPDEYCLIRNMIGDAQVFCHLLLGMHEEK